MPRWGAERRAGPRLYLSPQAGGEEIRARGCARFEHGNLMDAPIGAPPPFAGRNWKGLLGTSVAKLGRIGVARTGLHFPLPRLRGRGERRDARGGKASAPPPAGERRAKRRQRGQVVGACA